jgi:hypothetical protein
MLGDALPATIQARMFAAFGLELIYNKQDHQVTIDDHGLAVLQRAVREGT